MVNIFILSMEGTGWGTKAERRLGDNEKTIVFIIGLWTESSSLYSLGLVN